MSKPKPAHAGPIRRVRRLNLKALAVLGALALAGAALYLPIRMVSGRAVRASALAQANDLAARGEIDLALRHLDRSLATWPDDVPILEAAAKLQADSAGDIAGLDRASALNDQLLRLDPDGKDRQATRRRLVKLWILKGDAVRSALAGNNNAESGLAEIKENRYRAAVTIARQLLEKGDRDAEAHRLLAQALDGLFRAGDPKSQAEAVREYEEALRLDPTDWASAERLAQLDLESRDDPAGALETLDRLLRARPDSADVRKARYRHFTRAKREDRAADELAEAIKLAPNEVDLRLLAASEALRRNRPAEARAQLDAIPEKARDNLRVRMYRGMLESTEQHHEAAIEQWRQGLASVGGSDQDLTFQLAYALVRLDRLAEARPLIVQYQRLAGDDPRALGRYLQALAEQRSGHPTQAIASLEKIRDKVPEALQAELQVNLGACYEAIGEESRALIAYRKAVVAAPRNPEPRRAIARILQARNPEEATSEIDRALTLTPDDPTLLYEAARLQLARQRALPPADRNGKRLEEILDRGEKVAPGHFGFRSLRSESLLADGRIDEAVALLARSTEGPDRDRPESWLALATLLSARGEQAAALKALERGSAPQAAGDHVRLRVARAVMLARAGKGQEAREVLSRDRGRIPAAEQAELSRAQGDLARELGDRDAARAAFLDWSRLAPNSPDPALALLSLGKVLGDDEASRLGLEALRKVGGDREPYGLAAQALELLGPDRLRPGSPPAADLDRAERILAQLQAEAPQLPIGHLLRGTLLEYREKLPEAAAEYRLALKDSSTTAALVGLVGVLTRLKKYDELASLRKKYEDQNAEMAVGFDRISAIAALKLGDKGRAEYYAARIVERVPDSLEARAALARLLDEMGKPREAEATLRELVDRRPGDASAWASLVTFQALRGAPGEAARTVERARAEFKGDRPELLLGRCRWILNDLPAAVKLYDEALARRPDDPATLRAVAEFDAASGRTAELDGVLRKALRADPAAAWAGRLLALRLTSSNDPRTWAEAWKLVEPGAKAIGESPDDRLLRATILARCPDIDRRSEALTAMYALARDLPASSPVAVEARARLAQAMLDANRPAEAASWIAPVADDPRQANPVALAIAAEALARSGKPDEAQARLDRLVAAEPKSGRSTASKVWVLKARGQVAEAVAEIESAIAGADPSPKGEPLATAFIELARRVAPEADVDRLAALVSARWPGASYHLARSQLAKNQVPEALSSCRAALEAGSAREALRVATTLLVSHRDDPAVLKEVDSLAELARAKAPQDFDVTIFVATLRHIQARYDEELALYREALALNPLNVQFLNNMAWTLSEGLGRYDEALARVDDAIRRGGRTPQYLDTRGVILARLGRVDEALADLEASAKADPSATTYFHLARTYLKAGKKDESRKARDQALRANFDPKALDATDRDGLDAVMAKAP